LGNGDGTFQVPISYSVAAVSWSVSNALTVGDFNGDQRLDVVTIDTNNSMVSMLPGNGDGTLEASRFFFTVSDPQSALLGDFNGDGKPDLVVAGGCYDCN
jgi:hypothetical protein